jgi:hypothetical protein
VHAVLFITHTIFVWFLNVYGRLYCFPSESGLRSNKPVSSRHLLSRIAIIVDDWELHRPWGGEFCSFGLDYVLYVRPTLTKHVIGLRLKQTNNEVPCTCLKGTLWYSELERRGYGWYDKVF